MKTPLDKQTEILSDLWLNFRNEEDFEDFIEYNDLGLPLAYALNAGIIQNNERVTAFIEETFALFLAGLDIEEDEGFESLDDVLGINE